MKICLITKRNYTGKDLVSDRFGRLYHLPYHWAQQGAEVTVVALDYDANAQAQSFTEGRLSVITVPSKGLLLKPLTNGLQQQKFDLVIASGHVHLARLGLKFARMTQAVSVLDLYDYYPAFFGGFHPIFRIYLQLLLPRFDGAIAVSHRLTDWAGRWNSRLCRTPNGVDEQTFSPLPQNAARRELGLQTDRQYLGLFGSMSTNLGLDEVLEAFSALQRSLPNVELILAGRGGEVAAGQKGVRYLGLLEQRELICWASACDCLLIPYRESLQVYYSQSARMSEYMALGKPIVVTRCGDAETWFPPEYSGWCEPNDAASMLVAIRRQLEQREVIPLPDELRWSSLGEASYRFLQEVVASSNND